MTRRDYDVLKGYSAIVSIGGFRFEWPTYDHGGENGGFG